MWGSKSWHESNFEGGIQGDKWGHRWRGSQEYRFDFYMRLLDEVRTNEPLRILDIGCALGDFTKRLECLSPAVEITGIDIAENAISTVTRELSGPYQFAVSALPELPFVNSSFDLVVCTEVLYYLDESDLTQSFSEIRRILSDDGRAFISSSANKGERYFSEELVIDAAETEFNISSRDYLFGRLYTNLESPVIRLIQVMNSGRDFFAGDSTKQPEIEGSVTAAVFMLIRWLDGQIPYFAKIAGKLSIISEVILMWLVSHTFFARLMDKIARDLLGEWSKSHIILQLAPEL